MVLRLCCASCHKTLSVDPKLANCEITCPNCQHKMRVPGPSTTPASQAVTPRLSQAAALSPVRPAQQPPAFSRLTAILLLGGAGFLLLTVTAVAGVIVIVILATRSTENTEPTASVIASRDQKVNLDVPFAGEVKKLSGNEHSGTKTKQTSTGNGKSNNGKGGFAESGGNTKPKRGGGRIPILEDLPKRLEEKKAKSGDVQVSLAWSNKNDLDLHVVCPSGEKIFFGHRRSRCNGVLDVDMNVVYGRASNRPVENIYWPKGKAPNGRYRIYVHHYRNHGAFDCQDPTPFTVRLLAVGEVKAFDGVVVFNNPALRYVLVHEFEIKNGEVIHHKVKPGDNGNMNQVARGKVVLRATGALGPGSPQTNGKKPYISYKGNLVAGETYQIDLVSAQFDAFLYVRQNGIVVARDDDGGGGLNSRIRFTATTTGVHEIIASSFNANARGVFTLTLTHIKR